MFRSSLVHVAVKSVVATRADSEFPYYVYAIEEITRGFLCVIVDEFQEGLEHLYPLLEPDGGRSR